jgi:hypothetical protein
VPAFFLFASVSTTVEMIADAIAENHIDTGAKNLADLLLLAFEYFSICQRDRVFASTTSLLGHRVPDSY